MTTKIVARHQSGLWKNVDSPLFAQNTKRMRSGDCTLVSRTECTDQATNKTLKRDFPNSGDWGVYHPRLEGRPIDCALEWDKAAWNLEKRGLVQLTDFRVTTQGGVHLLPSIMPWVLLDATFADNLLLLFSAAHNNLDNTEARANAWIEEGHTFVHWQKQQVKNLRAQYPPSTRIFRLHQADMNKNIRLVGERRMVQNHMLANTGLSWGWNISKLPARGTHGKQIIDYSCSNGQHSSKVMVGDAFSDHNPIETILKV